MKLFVVLIILLFEVPTEAARIQKCFRNIGGNCRKKCEVGEINDGLCVNKKACCINEAHNKKYEEEQELLLSSLQSDKKLDYAILPTITLVTV
ncbi:beta-defensin 128 [Molossus molossus]|uniref:Beta-defensin n=1 Tax=Molossus molossus TaxID=27622 RepID=A0A7J8HFG1_MOLMO|nr:beta-defensin 128 [Molossus molossus]KAF6471084.1 defensin beta 128 [Molossus molossus]